MHEIIFVMCLVVGRVLMWWVSIFRVKGPGRVPRKGGVMLTSNHLSQWDLVVIHNLLPRSFYTMAKVEFFEYFFVGGLVRFIGAFPVNRGKADRQSLNYAVDLLKRGKLLMIFPEGHRSDNYALQEAHKGAALIALQADALIVPVGIAGTQLVSREKDWKNGLPFWKRRRPVTVTVGEPYRLPQPGPGERTDLDEATDIIMGKIADLLPPEYKGEYSAEKRAARQAERERIKQEQAERRAARRKERQQLSSTGEVTA